MLKYALIAGAAAAVLAIAWPLMTNVFSGGPNEATQLVEATGRTNNKAESLNDSFTGHNPPGPGQATPRPLPFRPAGKQLPPAPPSRLQTMEQPPDRAESAPLQPPTSTPPTSTPASTSSGDAIEYLNRLQQELEPSPTEYIQGRRGPEAGLGPPVPQSRRRVQAVRLPDRPSRRPWPPITFRSSRS